MRKNTSWEKVSPWYKEIVEEKGHYYHREVIFPKMLPSLLLSDDPILDLACGDGVLSRNLPSKIPYIGVDASASLIKAAKKRATSPSHRFYQGDIRSPLPIDKKDFTRATLILALQNLDDPAAAFLQAANHLVIGGKLHIVLNHPCFRIPKQSHWEIEREKKIQYRRVDRYLTSLEIPIQTNPGKKEASPIAFSYHYPLSSISLFLQERGFVISQMQEWCSNKKSTGKYAKMEDRAREEFPLFLYVVAEKITARQNDPICVEYSDISVRDRSKKRRSTNASKD